MYLAHKGVCQLHNVWPLLEVPTQLDAPVSVSTLAVQNPRLTGYALARQHGDAITGREICGSQSVRVVQLTAV